MEKKLCKCGCGEETPLAKKTCYKKGIIKGESMLYVPYHHQRGIPKSEIQRGKMRKTRIEWYSNNPEKAIEKAIKCSQTKIKEGTHVLEKNQNWRGGISYGDYGFEFNNRFREAIRLRDGRCLLCNLSMINALQLNKIMMCHHIDYDKKNTTPENCCLLCHNCHAFIQTNRKHWTLFFKSLLTELYDYQYLEVKNILGVQNGKNIIEY